MDLIQEYIETIKEDFEKQIETEKKSQTFNEPKIHRFIEDNPMCLLAATMNSNVDSYYLLGDSIFSKISLGNWEKRVPDFIMITYNSVEITFNLIEIEAPNRKIFTGSNDFTSDFNHAFTQLEDWQRLFPSNSDEMVKKMIASCFSDCGIYNGTRAIKANYILIYGSSDEYRDNGLRKKRISQKFQNGGLYFLSYDRLIKDFYYERALFTLKYDSLNDGFKPIGWSPFKNYTLGRRKSFGRIKEKEKLIKQSKYLSKEDKENLINSIKDLDSQSINKLEENHMGTTMADYWKTKD